jgi:hypothetical protein
LHGGKLVRGGGKRKVHHEGAKVAKVHEEEF